MFYRKSQEQTPFEIYCEARAMHALLLRCEGLTFREIAYRIENLQSPNNSISTEQARCLVMRARRRLGYAVRKAKFYWVEEYDPYDNGFDPLA